MKIRLAIAASLISFSAIAQEFPFTPETAFRHFNEMSDKQKQGIRLVNGGCRTTDTHICMAMVGTNVRLAAVANAKGSKAYVVIINSGGKTAGAEDFLNMIILTTLALESGDPTSTKAERGDAIALVLKSAMEREGSTADSVDAVVGPIKMKMSRNPEIGVALTLTMR